MDERQVAGSLWRYWSEEFGDEVRTVYPGEEVDLGGERRWVEVWLSAWEGERRRRGSPGSMEVVVTAHAFARERGERGAWGGLIGRIRQVLDRARVAVREGEESGEPVVGYLALRECEVRDLTRAESVGNGRTLEHVVVSCRGRAEEVD